MMSIAEIEFGTSDAETELIRSPFIFDNAFFDPHNYLECLLKGYQFVVAGRKGDGKSAFSAKIHRISENDEKLEAMTISLETLNSSFFEKFTDKDLVGGKRFVPMWKCILLLELIKHIEKRGFQIQRSNYLALVDGLNRMGLLRGDSVNDTITKLDSSEISISVSGWVSYGHHVEKECVIRGANQIFEVLSEELKSVYLSDISFVMIMDGLDDILRNKEFKIDIITGLIRAANEINNFFANKTLNFKTVILIRTDILDKCRDPDITKIRNGSRINLSWRVSGNLYDSDLAKLICARFKLQGINDDFKTIWQRYFPDNIEEKDSFEYMLENTLYKPRDILMFFSFAKEYIGKQDRKITELEFKQLLNKYSEEYFLFQMQDEITGFISDDAVNELPSVISLIGSRRFTYDDFSQEMSQHSEFDGINPEDVLKALFERGYLGQYRKRIGHPTKDEFQFIKHINPSENYRKADDCFLHRGLIRAIRV